MKIGSIVRNTTIALSMIAITALSIGRPPIIYTQPVEQVCVIPDGYIGIRSAADLQAISSAVNGHYALCNDVDLAGVTWNPIANFSGIFDGAGHTISNLGAFSSSASILGLFANITGGTVRNLNLTNFAVNTNGGYSPVGALAGKIGAPNAPNVISLIENLNVKGSVTCVSNCGLVAGISQFVTIQHVRVIGSITGSGSLGGIAGTITDFAMSDVAVTTMGSGITGAQNLGGIAGYIDRGTIDTATFDGIIQHTPVGYMVAQSVGGIVGFGGISMLPMGPQIRNSRASGIIKAHWMVGGIAGLLSSASIENVYSTVNITSTEGLFQGQPIADGKIGGLVGMMDGYGPSVKDSYYYGQITSSARAVDVGGVVGKNAASNIPTHNSFFVSDTTHNPSLANNDLNIAKSPAQLADLGTYVNWVDQSGAPKVTPSSDLSCTPWKMTPGSPPIMQFETGITCQIVETNPVHGEDIIVGTDTTTPESDGIMLRH